jgi:hypothetical protein
MSSLTSEQPPFQKEPPVVIRQYTEQSKCQARIRSLRFCIKRLRDAGE